MMPLALFGGGMLPLFFMPGWMATAANLSPVKWAILAIEGGPLAGVFSSGNASALPILVFVGLAAFASGLRAFRTE
jgi:ABC-2 type transport system permease protein